MGKVIGKEGLPEVLFIYSNGEIYKLSRADILSVESKERKILIRTVDDTVLLYKYSLSSLSDFLTEPFLQCHKSYIINRNQIKKFDCTKNVLIMRFGDHSIPVGRKYRELITQYMNGIQ